MHLTVFFPGKGTFSAPNQLAFLLRCHYDRRRLMCVSVGFSRLPPLIDSNFPYLFPSLFLTSTPLQYQQSLCELKTFPFLKPHYFLHFHEHPLAFNSACSALFSLADAALKTLTIITLQFHRFHSVRGRSSVFILC